MKYRYGIWWHVALFYAKYNGEAVSRSVLHVGAVGSANGVRYRNEYVFWWSYRRESALHVFAVW